MKRNIIGGLLVLGSIPSGGCSSDTRPPVWEVDGLDATTSADATVQDVGTSDAATSDDALDAREDADVDMAPPLPPPLDWSDLEPATRRVCVTEPKAPCIPRTLEDLGGCGQEIGYVFDGAQCVPAVGCPCEDEGGCGIFATASACARSCAADGWCQEDKLFEPSSPERDCTGYLWCDFTMTCVESDEDPTDELGALAEEFGDVRCREGRQGDFCAYSPGECGRGRWCCEVYPWSRRRVPEGEIGLCAMTLMPNVMGFECIELE